MYPMKKVDDMPHSESPIERAVKTECFIALLHMQTRWIVGYAYRIQCFAARTSYRTKKGRVGTTGGKAFAARP